MKNRKALLGAGVLGALVAIIAVSSFFPFVIDPSQWMTTDFFTKEVIIVVITIAGIVTSMFIGQSKNDGDPESEIAFARRRFDATSAKVKEDPKRFKQWVDGPMADRDVEMKRKRLMAKYGLDDDKLFKLDLTELESLLQGPKMIDGKPFNTLTQEQFRFIRDWKNGKYAIDFVDASYYLTCSAIRSNLTRSEKAGGESRDKTLLLGSATVSKVVMSLIIGITFASLVYDSAMAEDKAQMATAWMNFASRMVSLVTSVFSGFLLGYKVNDVEAEYINLRCDVHEEYLADIGFKAKTDDELIAEAIGGKEDGDKAIN